MNTFLSIFRQHSSSLIVLIVFLFFATWISDHQLFSDLICLYGISLVAIAIILNKKLNFNSAIKGLISLNTFIMFSFFTGMFMISSIISSPTVIFDSKVITGITLSFIYALIFKFVANKIYYTITGLKSERITKNDTIIVFLLIFSICIANIVTQYLFSYLPYLSPLYLLLSTIVFVNAFILQAGIIFVRNNQSKNTERKSVESPSPAQNPHSQPKSVILFNIYH